MNELLAGIDHASRFGVEALGEASIRVVLCAGKVAVVQNGAGEIGSLQLGCAAKIVEAEIGLA